MRCTRRVLRSKAETSTTAVSTESAAEDGVDDSIAVYRADSMSPKTRSLEMRKRKRKHETNSVSTCPGCTTNDHDSNDILRLYGVSINCLVL